MTARCCADSAAPCRMTGEQLDAAIESFVNRGWYVIGDDGDCLLVSMPEQVVELGLGVRVLRLGEVRSFDRAELCRELRRGAA